MTAASLFRSQFQLARRSARALRPDRVFGPGRTGLIGVNGSGKSTLLRLIAGELRPGSGSVRARGEVGYLPQAITLGTRRSVSDLLGITLPGTPCTPSRRVRPERRPSRRSGTTGTSRSEPAPGWTGWVSGSCGLDDRVERLSGGETILVALAALFLRRPDIMLLDEPTNNLDLDARRRLYEAVASWTGVMVIVSHDRELLGLVDQIADLSGGQIRMYGGNLAAYERAPRDRAGRGGARGHRAAADVRRERRDVVDAQVKQARRDRQGRKVADSGSLPRIVANARKKHAQETAGRSSELHAERLQAARDRLDEAEQAIRDDAEIRVELPATAVPAGRTVLTVTGLAGGALAPRVPRPTCPAPPRTPRPPADPAPAVDSAPRSQTRAVSRVCSRSSSSAARNASP